MLLCPGQQAGLPPNWGRLLPHLLLEEPPVGHLSASPSVGSTFDCSCLSPRGTCESPQPSILL